MELKAEPIVQTLARCELTGSENRSGVYLIHCLQNDRVYCGKASNLRRRWLGHLSNLRNGRHENKGLLHDFTTFGEEKFQFSILYESQDLGDVSTYERNKIKELLAHGNCYNLHVPGVPSKLIPPSMPVSTMTTEEFVRIARQRHGDGWKTALADETGWSWWTLNRVERDPNFRVSRKLERAIFALQARDGDGGR